MQLASWKDGTKQAQYSCMGIRLPQHHRDLISRELTLTLPRKTTSTRTTVSSVLNTRQHNPLMALLAIESCSSKHINLCQRQH